MLFRSNEGVIDPYQSAHLLNLPPIRANEGKRSKRVRAIPIRDLFKLYRALNPPWQDILAFHVLTGQRVETVLRATAKEFDTSAVPWKFVPTMHKTTWRGHDLTVLVGPRARKILQPLMETEGYFWPARKMNVKKGRQARHFPRSSSAYKNA